MFLNAISSHIAVSQSILDALTELHSLVNVEKEKSKQHYKTVQFEQGPVGRPRMVLSLEYISSLLDLNLSIPCIAALLGVSRRTVHRRMTESDLSVRALYSTLTDEELDQCVGVDRYVFFRADTDTDYYRSSRPITDILNRYTCLV